MTSVRQHAEKRYRVRHKLKVRNRNNHKRIYLHISNRHMNAQLIDDVRGVTLIGVSTVGQPNNKNYSNKENAKKLASEFASKVTSDVASKEEGFIFDRGSRQYHGIVAAFVDELRAQGLKV